MAVTVLLTWGNQARPWGYEVRVIYRDSGDPLNDINECIDFSYVPDAADITAAVENRRARVEELLILGEESWNLDHLDEMTFRFTTMPKMRRAVRDEYKVTNGLRCCRMARWLLANCNDSQLDNLFNRDVTALKVRLNAKVTKLTTWEAANAAAEMETGE